MKSWIKTTQDLKFPKPSLAKNKDISRLSFSGKLPEIKPPPEGENTEEANLEEQSNPNNVDENSKSASLQIPTTAQEGIVPSDTHTEADKKHVKISDDKDDTCDDDPQRQAMEKRSLSRVSTFTKASTNVGGSTGLYSCHSIPEKRRGRSNSIKSTHMQGPDDDNLFDSYLGEDPYEERRKMLLNQEEMYAMDLLDRKDDFLDDIDEYIRKQIEAQQAVFRMKSDTIPEELVRTTGFDIVELSRRQKRKMNMERRMTLEQIRAAELWKDVSKCRYLRVPDEKLDLSGLVVLAKDQMKLGKFV